MLYRSIILFMTLLFSLNVKAQYFHENAAGNIYLPPQAPATSYFELNQEDHYRFDEMLSYLRHKNEIPTELVHKYGHALSEYKRATQLVGGDVVGTRAELEQAFHGLNQHFHGLQSQKPELFAEFTEENSEFFSIKSNDPEGTPEFCQNFPQIYAGDSKAYFSGPGVDPDQHVFSTCREEGLFSVSLEDTLKVAQELDNRRLEPQERLARDQLMAIVSKSVLGNMSHYQGLFGQDVETGDTLNQCIEQKQSTHPQYAQDMNTAKDQIKTNDDPIEAELEFELFHSVMALKAGALFEKQAQLQAELQAVSVLKGRSRDPKVNQERRAQRDAARDSVSSKLAIIDHEIEKMYQQTPMLFKIENQTDLSTLTIVNMQIRPSDYQKTILDMTPESSAQIKKFQETIDSNLSPESLSQALFDTTEQMLDEIKTGKEGFKKASAQAISQHLNSLRGSLEKICESEGDFLHQNPALYPEIFNRIANEGSAAEARQNLLETQAGLCSLYRKEPTGNQNGSLSYYGGMAMIIGGGATTALTGWTGIGAAAGIGIMTAGGALLTADQYGEYQDAKLRASNADALLSTPWGEVRKALEAREEQRTAGILTAVEGVSTLTGLPLIRMASRLRAISSSRLSPPPTTVASNLGLSDSARIASAPEVIGRPITEAQEQTILSAHRSGDQIVVQGDASVPSSERLDLLKRYLPNRNADELESLSELGTITRQNHLELEGLMRSAGASDEEIARALHRQGYSQADLAAKRDILIEGGFTPTEAGQLLRAGITGGKTTPYPVYRGENSLALMKVEDDLKASPNFSNMTYRSTASSKPPISVYVGSGDPLRMSVADATTVLGRMRNLSREYIKDNNLAAAIEASRIEADIATSLAKHLSQEGVASSVEQYQRYAMEAAISRGAYRRLSGRSGMAIDEDTLKFLRDSGYSDSLSVNSIDRMTHSLRTAESYGKDAPISNLREYANTIELLRNHRNVLASASRSSDYSRIVVDHRAGASALSPSDKKEIIELIDRRLMDLERAESILHTRFSTSP